MKKIISFVWLLGKIALLGLVACSGDNLQPTNQVTSLLADTQFETVACEARTRIINVRNEDTAEPQRIMGIYFEMGTNEDKFFSLDKVAINSVEFKPTAGGIAEELIIPAGGVAEVYVSYKPNKITEEDPDVTYLDFLMAGDGEKTKLGIFQMRLSGFAPTAAEGCGEAPVGTVRSFTVNSIKVNVIDKDEAPIEQTPTTTDLFTFTEKDGVATLTPEGFPKFIIETPSIDAPVVLKESAEGTFDGSKLEFTGLKLNAGGVIDVENVSLSTGTLTVENVDGKITVTGSALASGKMTIVLAVKLPDLALLTTLQGGVIGVTMELTEQ